MRFRIDLGKAYLAGCLALSWGLTACVSEITTVQMPADTGYELVGQARGLERGMMSTKILDADGKEVFNSTYNIETYNEAHEVATPSMISMLDSLNLKAIGALLSGKGQGTQQQGAVSFSLGGKTYSINVTHRGNKGEARDFVIALGSSDTTLAISSTDAVTANKHFELKTGNHVVYSGVSVVGAAQNGASIGGEGGDPEEENCLGRFAEISIDLGLAVAGIAHGLATLDAFEIFAAIVMLVNGIAQIYLWIVEDCYNTFMDWLNEFWIDNCLNPLFAWTPFCEE